LQIHDAAKEGDYDRLQQLLAGGCPVDTFDERGMTPLAGSTSIVAAFSTKLGFSFLAEKSAERKRARKHTRRTRASTNWICDRVSGLGNRDLKA
jgi:hypothetical protein